MWDVPSRDGAEEGQVTDSTSSNHDRSDLPAPAPAAATTTPLPTTTEPEQLHLAWGSDPSTEVTVSWAAPGTVAQPAPKLAYSRHPITAETPGKVIALPKPEPLEYTRPRAGV